jgi:pentatricopeptide repeat protein
MITAKRTSPQKVREESQVEVYLPKCLVILSMYPYLIAFREFLTQLNRLSKMGEMTLPLERYIANFCAEIPAPPPGSFEVQTTILDSVIKIWSPPHNQPIPWVSLPFGHLFECLDIENIVLVWHCLALERQVLVTSTQMSLLTECAEILLSMLFPMRWSHAYIPVLPHFLIPILSAPMPFLCGIHKGNLADALCDLSRECVVVDLDKNLVTLGPDTAPLPPLPPQMKSILTTRLEENVGMVFREARSLRKNDDYSGSGEHLQPHVKLMADGMWEGRLCLFDEAFHLFFTPEESRKNLLNGNDTSGMDSSERDNGVPHIITLSEKQNMRKQSPWDAVQEAFLDCYVYLLRNYRKFLVFPSKDNEGSYGGAGFRSKEFVQTQRYDMQPLLEELIGTQVFDNFVTKRLYGSGEADVTFFDAAVDHFLKNQGLLSSGGRMLRARGWGTGEQKGGMLSDQGPLLQSARVHRKLKTIVPPEPSSEDLPPHPLEQNQHEGGPVVTAIENDHASELTDDLSVNSASTYSTSTSHPRSPGKSLHKSIQDKAAEILDKSKYRYTYETFPSEFDVTLFGTPRPLPSAVIAEFDRQKKDAARFRRKKPTKNPKDKKTSQRAAADAEIPPSAEVATFTLFFMAFSAVVGKELLEISDNPLIAQDKTILATYNHPSDFSDLESDEEGSIPTTIATSTNGNEDEFEDALDGVSVNTDGAEKGSRPGESFDEEEIEESKQELPEPVKEKKPKATKEAYDPTKPRSRFQDSLSALQIEERKATGRAQLALAFEMLTMMKKRGLKADPEAYQCLIDACGRVGDTRRATELLAKMHEDGIVADGVVYSCLVSAFSVESAWKQSTKEQEELPGTHVWAYELNLAVFTPKYSSP